MSGIGVMAMGTPQHQLEHLLRGLRAGAPESTLVLSLDSRQGVNDISALAALVDGLFYSRTPLGFGAARQRLIAAAEVLGLSTMVVADGDGQFGAPALLHLYQAARGATGPRLVLAQRSRRSLPATDSLQVRRETLERFENWVIARDAGHEELAHWDLQPGAFCAVGERVLRVLRDVRERGFVWDLAMARACFGAGIRMDAVPVDSAEQTSTSFTSVDAVEKLRWLRDQVGPPGRLLDAFLDADSSVSRGEAGALSEAVLLL